LLLAGRKVITDDDLFTRDEMSRDPLYTELLAPIGLRWWAAVGAGSGLWRISIQRTSDEGPFSSNDKVALAELSERLTETARLSKAVGDVALSSTTNALNLVGQPALLLDRLGFVLQTNASAEALFNDDLRARNRRLFVRDIAARHAVERVTDQLRTVPNTIHVRGDPIIARRETGRPIVIDVLPIHGAARTPFLGARALMLLTDLNNSRRRAQGAVMKQAFGLTVAEARVAEFLAMGGSIEHAAQELRISRETARNQLKAVFAKTGTHRQGELVALLARL
jgi:DNA-binding CsgD family transcriptional regulator